MISQKGSQKTSRRDLERINKQLMSHNQELSLFADELIRNVEKCYKAASELHDGMHLLISPMSIKAREVLGNICFTLGPYCVTKQEFKIVKGKKNAVQRSTDRGSEQTHPVQGG